MSNYEFEPDMCEACEDAQRPSGATGYVAVPKRELQKLEEARMKLYEHLGQHVGSVMLHELTKQIWKVANTKKWD